MYNQSLKVLAVGLAGVALVWGACAAQASMKEIKAYKEAFPEAKPKCIECHDVALPKKDDGMHGLNDYGKAVVKAAAEPTAETYKSVGAIENFKPATK